MTLQILKCCSSNAPAPWSLFWIAAFVWPSITIDVTASGFRVIITHEMHAHIKSESEPLFSPAVPNHRRTKKIVCIHTLWWRCRMLGRKWTHLHLKEHISGKNHTSAPFCNEGWLIHRNDTVVKINATFIPNNTHCNLWLRTDQWDN